MPVYKQDNGKWYVKYSTKDPVTGQRVQVLKRGFSKQSEAKSWEADQLASRTTKTSATFMQMFEENLKYLNSSETAATMKRSWITRHFPYCFEHIEQITKPMLIEWRNSMEYSKLAVRTRNRGIGYVRSVFTYANAIYNIPNNGVVIRSFKLKKEDKKEMVIWNLEEFNQFISSMPEGYYKAFFVFQYWMGTRRGEGMAVCKEDFNGNTVRIHRQIKHYVNGFTELKTGTSERTLTIDKVTYEYLKPYIEDANPFVFGGTRSLPITNIQRELKKYIEISGVKEINLHSLRHSHASVLIASGVPIIAVSKRLGHASVNITLSTYAHMLQRTEDEMIATIDALREKERL